MTKIQTETYVQGRVEYRGTPPANRQHFKVVRGVSYHGQDEVMSFSPAPPPDAHFLLELEPGTYSIIEAERPAVFAEPAPGASARTMAHVGKVRAAWQQPLATFTVALGDPMSLVVVVPASP